MNTLARILASCGFALVLWGCADSESRSLVSRADIPAGKYRKVAVFLQPIAHGDRAAIESAVISALRSVGIEATSGMARFGGRNITDKEIAARVQKEFDAVLNVSVLVSGMRERLVEGARHDGEYISVRGETKEIDIYVQNAYVLKPDGTVYEEVPTLHTRSDLQDAKTAKVVWGAETIATGGTVVLVGKASSQIVEKMRADGAI